MIKNHDFKYLIIFNLIFITVIYFDFLIPFNHHKTEKIKSFYKAVNYTPGFRSKGSKEIKYILECESGNFYYLGKFPPEFEALENGKNVDIQQTLLFQKTKTLKVDGKEYTVSFLSINLVTYIFIFCLLTNLINFFYSNKILDIVLAFGTVPIYFVGLVYIFSY